MPDPGSIAVTRLWTQRATALERTLSVHPHHPPPLWMRQLTSGLTSDALMASLAAPLQYSFYPLAWPASPRRAPLDPAMMSLPLRCSCPSGSARPYWPTSTSQLDLCIYIYLSLLQLALQARHRRYHPTTASRSSPAKQVPSGPLPYHLASLQRSSSSTLLVSLIPERHLQAGGASLSLPALRRLCSC